MEFSFNEYEMTFPAASQKFLFEVYFARLVFHKGISLKKNFFGKIDMAVCFLVLFAWTSFHSLSPKFI